MAVDCSEFFDARFFDVGQLLARTRNQSGALLTTNSLIADQCTALRAATSLQLFDERRTRTLNHKEVPSSKTQNQHVREDELADGGKGTAESTIGRRVLENGSPGNRKTRHSGKCGDKYIPPSPSRQRGEYTNKKRRTFGRRFGDAMNTGLATAATEPRRYRVYVLLLPE